MLFRSSQGCAVSIAYAYNNPEKVTHSILSGGFARGKAKRGTAAFDQKIELENDIVLRVFDSIP